MRILAVIVLIALIILIAPQIYSFWAQGNNFEKQAAELKVQLDKAQQDAAQLKADIEYFQNPANLEKELRARFNYKNPDEKTIILVPQKIESGRTTSTN